MKESRESRVRPLKKQILSKISLFFSALKKKRAQKLRNNRNRERQFPPPRRRGDLSAEKMNHRRGRGGLAAGGKEGRDETPLAICQELLSCFYRVVRWRGRI